MEITDNKRASLVVSEKSVWKGSAQPGRGKIIWTRLRLFILISIVLCTSCQPKVFLKDGYYNARESIVRFRTDGFFEDRSEVYSGVGTYADRDTALVFCREKRSELKYQESLRFLSPRDSGISIRGVNETQEPVLFYPSFGLPHFEFDLPTVVADSGSTFQIDIPSDSTVVFINILGRISFKKFIPQPGVYEANWDLETRGTDFIMDSGCFSYDVLRRTKDTIWFTYDERVPPDTSYFVKVRDERKTMPLFNLPITEEQISIMKKRLFEKMERNSNRAKKEDE